MLVQTWYQWSIPQPYSSQHMPGENKNQYLKGEGIGGRGRHILIAAKGSTVASLEALNNWNSLVL